MGSSLLAHTRRRGIIWCAERGRRCWRSAVIVSALLASAQTSHAQDRAPSALEVLAGSELENYLRALQVAGAIKYHPWAIRGFSSRELRSMLPADTAQLPWRISDRGLRRNIAVSPLSLRSVFNSAFPYGGNDGAVWAGRGFTVSAAGGIRARMGPFSLTVAPVAFVAQNQGFRLLENGGVGAQSYNDGLFPGNVDRPQRFGDKAYGRVDLGASELRLDTRFVTFGAGTAPMWWGPAMEYPFVLGNNAAGIPHVFLGTGAPVNIWLGKAHARVTWGKLSQSDYSPVTGSDRYVTAGEAGRDRLMAGMVLVFIPRLAPNLELGLARFAHIAYRPDGMNGRFLRSPIPTFLKKGNYGDPEIETGNELAAFFARWVFPAAGFEIYAEHGQDDWFHDLRDLTQEPDHNRSYGLGFQKAFNRSRRNLGVLRGEIINYQMPPLGRDRPGQGFIYTHAQLRQGHTLRGQLLGSNAGVGAAAASILAWDRYSPAGRTTVAWRRIVRAHTGTFYLDGTTNEKATDVIHSLGAERSRGNSRFRYTLGAELVANFNRNFSNDVFNLNARAGLEWSPWSAR